MDEAEVEVYRAVAERGRIEHLERLGFVQVCLYYRQVNRVPPPACDLARQIRMTVGVRITVERVETLLAEVRGLKCSKKPT